MLKAVKRDKLDELMHSAKGTTWADHKYIAIKNGRYIYPEEAKRGLNKLRQNHRNLGNDRGIPAKKNIYENPKLIMPSEANRGLHKLFYNKENKHTFNLDTTKYPFNKINRDEQTSEMKKEHEEARKRRNQKSSEKETTSGDIDKRIEEENKIIEKMIEEKVDKEKILKEITEAEKILTENIITESDKLPETSLEKKKREQKAKLEAIKKGLVRGMLHPISTLFPAKKSQVKHTTVEPITVKPITVKPITVKR